jgi:hypothetical protein
MLFSPAAHEALTDETWSADRASRWDHGRGRYTLWTGDLGTALYLADCIDGGGTLPLP